MPFDATPMRRVDTEALEMLDRAIDLIRKRENWCQKVTKREIPRGWFGFVFPSRYQYCMLGALIEVGAAQNGIYAIVPIAMQEGKFTAAAAAVQRAVEERGAPDIWTYNDTHSHEEVLRVMARAREILTQ